MRKSTEQIFDAPWYPFSMACDFHGIKNSKGFCVSHFGDLCEMAERKIPDKEKEAFFNDMFALMESNMDRLFEDVSWLIEKFDYRNKDADWKNSKDAVNRGMQKLKGGYPADPVYKMQK